MATTAPESHGQICWLEVPVASVSRAATFYSSVLGWECNDLEGTPSPGNQAKSVHMFKKGSLNGAFLLVHDEEQVNKVTELASPKRHAPVTTFHVESIEETIKKIEAAEGKVHVYVDSLLSPPVPSRDVC